MKNLKKSKKKIKNLKKFTVYYTPYPVEHELVVEAVSLKAAVRKVESILKDHAKVKAGWEVSAHSDT